MHRLRRRSCHMISFSSLCLTRQRWVIGSVLKLWLRLLCPPRFRLFEEARAAIWVTGRNESLSHFMRLRVSCVFSEAGANDRIPAQENSAAPHLLLLRAMPVQGIPRSEQSRAEWWGLLTHSEAVVSWVSILYCITCWSWGLLIVYSPKKGNLWLGTLTRKMLLLCIQDVMWDGWYWLAVNQEIFMK